MYVNNVHNIRTQQNYKFFIYKNSVTYVTSDFISEAYGIGNLKGRTAV